MMMRNAAMLATKARFGNEKERDDEKCSD